MSSVMHFSQVPNLSSCAAPSPQAAPATQAPACRMDSTAILQGRKTVEISHNGLTYRLQATRLGKLILTK